jgi:hypothetical protein
MLKVGSRGTDVVRLQKALKAAGLNVGKADGVFGAKTKAAVASYQRAHHLSVDGVVGKNTGSKLLKQRNSDGWDGANDRPSRTSASARPAAASPGRRASDSASAAADSTPQATAASSVNGVPVTNSMRRFAATAKQTALGMNGYHGRGQCAKGVNRSILKSFGIRNYGNGNQIDNNLPKSKFRQLNISLKDALKIPGLVLTWERTSTPKGKIYGHTAITLGDGKGSASDFVERNTLAAGGRSGFKVFQPI